MSRADKLREQARKLVEGVMKTEETLSAEILQVVRADVHRLELEAEELDEQTKSVQFRTDVP